MVSGNWHREAATFSRFFTHNCNVPGLMVRLTASTNTFFARELSLISRHSSSLLSLPCCRLCKNFQDPHKPPAADSEFSVST